MPESDPTPEWRVPAKLAEWEGRRVEIRSRLIELLGHLPPRPAAPAVEILSTQDRGDSVLERFAFDNGAGARVPGYYLRPQGTGPFPAILHCHWHGGEYEIGKESLFQARHSPAPPGPTLVKLGYAVLGIDAYCFGERNGHGPGSRETSHAGEMTAAKHELWHGRTLWGMMLRDDLIALDHLASRPEVDATRLGVTGVSMGATRSWWLMALDERLRAGVAVACLTRYQNLIAREALKAHGIYYYVPGMLRHFDTEAVVALAAPRALLCLNGDRDEGSPVDGIGEIETRARPVWGLYEKDAHFRSEIFRDTGHEYTPAMWDGMLAWFERHLK